MATEWEWRIYLFVRASDATNANRNALADIYVNNGTGSTRAEEKKMFDAVTRLSTTGVLPAQIFGINLTAKKSMRDEFLSFLEGLNGAAWAVVANTETATHADGELISTSDNLDIIPNGQTPSWAQAVAWIAGEFNVQVIPEAEAAATEDA